MDRIALSKRLESLSSVFASHTPYNRDLKAMSYVLTKMSNEKFSSIVAQEWMPETDPGLAATEDPNACMLRRGPGPMGPGSIVPTQDKPKVVIIQDPLNQEEAAVMSAETTDKTAGMYWNKEASEAVMSNLLRDVVGMDKKINGDTGRKLEKKQIPDGSHSGEKAKTLKPEQTPDQKPALDSDMYNKSKKTPLRKEAGSIKGPGIPDGTGPHRNTPSCPMSKEKDKEEKEAGIEDLKSQQAEVAEEKAEKLEEKAKEQAGDVEKSLEQAEKLEERAEKKEDQAEKEDKKTEDKEEDSKESSKRKEATAMVFEGIELTASMDEVELDPTEASELSKLFE